MSFGVLLGIVLVLGLILGVVLLSGRRVKDSSDFFSDGGRDGTFLVAGGIMALFPGTPLWAGAVLSALLMGL